MTYDGIPLGVQSRAIEKVGSLCRKGLYFVGSFCRKGLSPQSEPPWDAHPLYVAAWPFFLPRLVAASREVLLGNEDVPKTTTAPRPSGDTSPHSQFQSVVGTIRGTDSRQPASKPLQLVVSCLDVFANSPDIRFRRRCSDC